MPVGHLCVLFGKMSTQVFCPFFNQVVFLILSCMSCLYILYINPSLDISFAIFFPFCRLSFHFVDGFFFSNIYLFIYLVALGLNCGSWAP